MAKRRAGKSRRADRPTFEQTDHGNAERLVYYYGERIKYVEKWQIWLVWSGRVWERDPSNVRIMALAMRAKERIRDEIAAARAKFRPPLRRWLKQSGSRGRLEAMIGLAKALPDMTVQHERLDQHPFLLNCRNGTVNLKTGSLREHQPADLLTKMIDVEYNPAAEAPRFVKFLKKVMPHRDVRLFLQRFAGYCSTGDVGERMFVVLFGGGRNGKSVFLRVLQKALGPYATSAAPGLLMAKQQDAHPAEIADLQGARLAVASEVRKGRVFDEEAVKRLTGNDTLKARFMRENFWEYDPTFKLLIAANHKPRVRDASDSFWDRIALVGFNVRIAKNKVDGTLQTKIVAGELQGVLAWIVRGCQMWQEKGLNPPETVQAATKSYRDSEDMIGQFLTERCELKPEEADMKGSPFTPTSLIMRAAKKWCIRNNHKYVFSEKDLAERLAEAGCVLTRSKSARGWRGITLLSVDKLRARRDEKSSSESSGDEHDQATQH